MEGSMEDQLCKLTQAITTLSTKTEEINLKFTEFDSKLNGLKVDFNSDCKGIVKELEEMKKSIDRNLAQNTKDITFLKDNMEQVLAQTQKLEIRVAEDRSTLSKHEKRLAMLEEMSRKGNLILRGVEQHRIDNLKKRVLDWLNSIGLGYTLTPIDLLSVYRIGFQPRDGSIRNVLIKFANVVDKFRVLAKIREDEEKTLRMESRRIQVYHDISKEERSWRYKIKPITKFLRDNNIKYNWRYPQSLRFFYNKRMHTLFPGRDPILYLEKIGLLVQSDEREDLVTQLKQMGGDDAETSTTEKGPEEERGARGPEEVRKGKRKQLELSAEKDKRDKRDRRNGNGSKESGEEAGTEEEEELQEEEEFGMKASPAPKTKGSRSPRQRSQRGAAADDPGEEKL